MSSANDNLEPCLDEMFAEPIVRHLMARDGNGEDKVRTLLRLAARQRQADPAAKLHFTHARPQLQRSAPPASAYASGFATPTPDRPPWPRVFPGL